jgi:hypothetical protein
MKHREFYQRVNGVVKLVKLYSVKGVMVRVSERIGINKNSNPKLYL